MAIIQLSYYRGMKTAPAPNRIVELREALGMSQAELARRANVTPSAINKLEKGTRGLDLDWMRRLAPILKCAPVDLMPIADNPYALSESERELIGLYRAASEMARAQAVAVLKALFRTDRIAA